MTLQELELQVRELGLSFSFHQAMSGSQYITINSVKFRISDHFQPSHYQYQNHIDVFGYSNILSIVSNPLFLQERFSIHDGKKVIYNEKNDTFSFQELTEEDIEMYNKRELWRKEMGMSSFLNN